MDLIEIQAEQIVWSEKNFGKQPAMNPLEGMIEEMCEFDMAWDERKELVSDPTDRTAYADEVIDAIGDIGIYMVDYLGKRGWSMHQFWLDRNFYDDKMMTNWSNLVPLIRKLAHHDLKGRQGIRGGAVKHDMELQRTCRAILSHLERISAHMNKDFLQIIDQVWSKVRLRDWTKNKDNAHEVAEQQGIKADTMAKNNAP